MVKKRRINDSIRYKTIDETKCKLCLMCNEYLPMTNEYFYKKNTKDGLNSYCIPCSFKKSREWVDSNPEKYKILKLKKVANKTEAQKQRSRDSSKERNLNGKFKKWQQENRNKIKDYNEYRSMNKKHDISESEWDICKDYFDYACAYCSLPLEQHFTIFNGKSTLSDFHKEHFDHDGANDITNCIPSCKSCNSRKHIKTFDEWYCDQNEVYSKRRFNKICKWIFEIVHNI